MRRWSSVGTTDASGVINQLQVRDLPLNGRSYDELLTLNPGVVNFTWEKTGGIGVSNSTNGNNFAVEGNRPQQNLFLLNGIEFTGAAENNMQPGGASQQLLGVDAVREFNVLRDSYGAEYGKRPGAQVLIVTQSGTNQLHGSLYEFLRNNALDARNFFDGASAPGFQRNQFGGVAGRPDPEEQDFRLRQFRRLPPAPAPDRRGSGARQQRAQRLSALQAGQPRAEPLPGVRTGVRRRFAADQRVARADARRARFRRHLRSVQQSAANHSRRFRHRCAWTTSFLRRDTLSAVYTIDDSADFTPTSTNALQHRRRDACANRWRASRRRTFSRRRC